MFDPSVIFRPEIIWVFIPITAITLGIGTGLVKIILESSEKRLELRLRLKQERSSAPVAGQDAGLKQQIETLRAEIVALRDTSTQFDVSFDHALEQLEARMQTMEKTRVPYPTATANQEEQTQIVGGS